MFLNIKKMQFIRGYVCIITLNKLSNISNFGVYNLFFLHNLLYEYSKVWSQNLLIENP